MSLTHWFNSWLSVRPVRRGKFTRHSRRFTSLAGIERLEQRVLLSENTLGPEFRVNTQTAGNQQATGHAVASDAAGDFVVAWESAGQDGSSYGVYAQRYNAAGVPQGNEFQVNTYTSGSQSHASVAMNANGDFVIVWQSDAQDGSGSGIDAQRFNAAGTPQGTEIHVNSYTTGAQELPSVAMDDAGDFVITWQDGSGRDGSGYGVYSQRYNAAGTAQGSEFQVNTYTTGDQSHPSVAMDATGEFVITWQSAGQDPGPYFVNSNNYAQRYNAEGVAQGGEIRVSTLTIGPPYADWGQYVPAVAMDAAGDFVIAWEMLSYQGVRPYHTVYAQRFNATGAPLGSTFLVNTNTYNTGYAPSVTMSAEGDFVITWDSTYDVFAQTYDATGLVQGHYGFEVNSYDTGNQSHSAVAIDAHGDFVVTWQSSDQDGSGYGVYAQRYTLPPRTFQITGTTLDVYALAENNLFSFGAGATSFSVSVEEVVPSMNGRSLFRTFDLATISTINFHGGAGNNEMHFTGSSGDDTITLNPYALDVTGAGYTVHGTGMKTIIAYAGGGDDLAYLYASNGIDDFFSATPYYAALGAITGTGFTNIAYGFDTAVGIDLFPQAGQHTTALYTSTQADVFVGKPEFSELSGNGFNNVAIGYPVVIGYNFNIGNPAHVAYLYTSTASDAYVATPAYAQLYGNGFNNVVNNYSTVVGVNIDTTPGAVHNAVLVGSPTVSNVFVGTTTYGLLTGTDFLNYALQFSSVSAIGSGKFADIAYLFGSAADDTFIATPAYARLLGITFNNIGYSFGQVYLYGTPGSTAYLYDSPGNDEFYGRANYGVLTGTGFFNDAVNFSTVVAISSAGGIDTLDTAGLGYTFQRIGNWH